MIHVSVVLCCYNDGEFVRNALASLYEQTFSRDLYEVVFIDDGSVDGTAKAASEYQSHANFRYFRNEGNLGLVRSCNRALDLARGDYIVRLDADDSFCPTLLEEMCPPLDRGDTDFVYCDREEFLADGGEERYVKVGDFDVFRLIAIGTMMRRQLMLEVGGYRNLFWEEYDLYLRYLQRSKKSPCYIPKPLIRYMIRPGAMTSDPAKVKAGWKEFRRMWPTEIVQPFGTMPEQAYV